MINKSVFAMVATSLIALSTSAYAKSPKGKEGEPGSSTINLIWRARGLQAIEKLEKLAEKKSLSDKEKCDVQLETMFMQFAKPELAKLIIKKAQDIEWFILAKETGNSVGQISFGYEGENSAPTAWKVVKPDNDWQIVHVKNNGVWANLFSIGKCNYLIDIENPINTHTLNATP